MSDIRIAIESVLFVAHGPVDIATLARAAGVSESEVEEELAAISEDYRGRGLRIQRTGEAAKFVSAPEAAPYVESYLGVDENQTITPAALETLAIIAYKQPISRSAIERIRGVNCDYAVAALKARELITEVGRAASPGRPYLYGTTFRFLEHFGLEKPDDLPPLPELDSALAGHDETAEIASTTSGRAATAEEEGPGAAAPFEVVDDENEDEEPFPSDEAVEDSSEDEDAEPVEEADEPPW